MVHRAGTNMPAAVAQIVILCRFWSGPPPPLAINGRHGRGRDEDFSSPPAQIPACAANAPGSSLGSNVGGTHGLKPHALRRTAANRIDVAARLSVRTTAACRLFPSGEALPSKPPPEVAFLCSVASSVLRPHPTSHPRTCSACGFCLPEPARHKSGHG